MSSAVHYPTRRYYHIGREELFIDHREKQSFWKKLEEQLKQSGELLNARWKVMIDKRLRASYRTNLIRNYLRGVGLNGFDLLKPETFAIAKILHKDEIIYGAIVGHVPEGGSALIVVTDLRVIYLNQIPLFSKLDEIGYAAVTGVSSNGNRWGHEVTVHTGMGDFKLFGVNPEAARKFVNAVEEHAIDTQEVPHGTYQEAHQLRLPPNQSYS